MLNGRNGGGKVKIKVLVSILALIAILTATGCENDNGASQMP